MRGAILAMGTLLALTGCASLSEEQCLRGDWRGIGYADGVAGRTPDRIQAHAKACAEAGIAPDVAAWEKGRQEGLPLYCTPDNAYEEGRDGRVLTTVCPAAQQARLRSANRAGLRYRELLDDIDDAERRQREILSLMAGLPPGDPRRGALQAEYSSLQSELMLLRLQRLRLNRP